MKKLMNAQAFSRKPTSKPLQRGLVLEIVLIVLIAIFLAAIGLYRSVDTSTGVAGNLAFKRDAENRAQVALNGALAWLEDDENYKKFILAGESEASQNFSARMLQTDAKGIPVVLTGDIGTFESTYTLKPTNGNRLKDDDAGMQVHYVIERMCTQLGPMSEGVCSVAAGVGKVKVGGTQPGDPLGSKVLRPLLRVSIRVDGPRDTVAYVQAMIDP